MTNTAKTIDVSIQSIQGSINKILVLTKGQSEETIRLKPTEEEWSILQILAHLVEAIPYWLNEVQRVVSVPGSEWGRGLQAPERLEAVNDTGKLSLAKVVVEVEALKEKIEVGLSGLDEEKLAKESPHRNFAKFGNKPVSFIIDHFIEEHLNGHYDQIKRNLLKLDK
ncbi:DinB family protein [Salipaludibacillus sp. CF4.18]|uniref:DinB family protein n=1 Tax=Salipaludibacillus sp. CF4.18 TaxID=3373081 RepID=UPI003EE6F54C